MTLDGSLMPGSPGSLGSPLDDLAAHSMRSTVDPGLASSDLAATEAIVTARRKTQLRIEDLVAINFPVSVEETPFMIWPEYNQYFMPVDTCARFLLLGSRQTFESDQIPQAFKDKINKQFVGEEAYKQVLRIACGLESPKKGEEQVLGQLKSRFDEFNALGLDREWSVTDLMTRIIADAKSIRSNILRNLRPASLGHSAAKIGEITDESVVLVIGDRAENTLEYLRAFGRDSNDHSGKRAAREIYFTHPVEASLDSWAERIGHEKYKRTISCEISTAPFDSAMEIAVPFCTHIFCCLPLDSTDYNWRSVGLPKLISALTRNWRDDESPESLAEHVHFVELGKPLNGESQSAMHMQFEGNEAVDWMTITRGRFIPRTLVVSDHTTAKDQRSALFQMAEHACENAAWTRAIDIKAKPLPEFFHFDPEEYQQYKDKIFKSSLRSPN